MRDPCSVGNDGLGSMVGPYALDNWIQPGGRFANAWYCRGLDPVRGEWVGSREGCQPVGGEIRTDPEETDRRRFPVGHRRSPERLNLNDLQTHVQVCVRPIRASRRGPAIASTATTWRAAKPPLGDRAVLELFCRQVELRDTGDDRAFAQSRQSNTSGAQRVNVRPCALCSVPVHFKQGPPRYGRPARARPGRRSRY